MLNLLKVVTGLTVLTVHKRMCVPVGLGDPSDNLIYLKTR